MAGQYAPSVDAAANAAVAAERDGYDGWCAFETQIDPFLGCAVAAERTERIDLGTSIVVAFARNPMTVALQANDVQALSGAQGEAPGARRSLAPRQSAERGLREISFTTSIIGPSSPTRASTRSASFPSATASLRPIPGELPRSHLDDPLATHVRSHY